MNYSILKPLSISFFALSLSACATTAQREGDSIKQILDTTNAETLKCKNETYNNTKYKFINQYFVKDDGFTIEQLANQSTPTQSEVKLYAEFYNDLKSCQRIKLDGYRKASPLLASPLEKGYSNADNVVVAILHRKITWGEALQRQKAISNTMTEEIAHSAAIVDGRLENSHQAEIAQRQVAAAAMHQGAYQQQIINNMNRPIKTDCSNYGSYFNCTSY